MDAASSGKLVPTATTENPMSSSGILNFKAIVLAPKTNVSEPSQRPIADKMIKIIEMIGL